MREYVARWKKRVWAIEGCAGIGGHVAERLVKAGEDVVDVPPKLSARARVFISGQGRKTDATDAHSVALVGVRMAALRAFELVNVTWPRGDGQVGARSAAAPSVVFNLRGQTVTAFGA